MRLRFSYDDAWECTMQAHLSPVVREGTSAQAGWEEQVDAAMVHLLRTRLAKSTKQAATAPAPLAFPKDTAKLKKHITIVCDRLAKRSQRRAAAEAAAGGEVAGSI